LCFNLETLLFESITSVLPIGIEGPKVLAIDHLVYIMGGGLPGNERGIEDRMFLFNAESDSLEILSSKLPEKYMGFVPCLIEDNILLIGGYYIDTASYTNEIWRLSLSDHSLTRVGSSLDMELQADNYIIKDNFLLSYSFKDSDGQNNSLISVDLDTFGITIHQLNYLPETRRCFALVHDDFHSYVIGGGIDPFWYYGIRSVFQLYLSFPDSNMILEEKFSQDSWETTNSQIFSHNPSNRTLSWSFEDTFQSCSKPFDRVTKPGDLLEVEVKYSNHYDPNSRQVIFSGFTDNISNYPVNNSYTRPIKNFIGITIRNNIQNVEIKTLVLKDTTLRTVLKFQIPNVTHLARFQVWIFNNSHYYQTFTLDGNVIAEGLVPEDLTGMPLKAIGVWNQNTGPEELQGQFNGANNFLRYQEEVSEPHNSDWSSENIPSFVSPKTTSALTPILLIFVFLLTVILILGILIEETTYGVQFRKNIPEGFPTDLVPSYLHSLYNKLKVSFTRLDLISKGFILKNGSSSEVSNSVANDLLQYHYTQRQTISTLEITDFRGITIQILMHLLDFLDRGTYANVIEIDLEIKKSTLSYNLTLLEERGLIQVSNPKLEADQRLKVISITNGGIDVLYCIYTRLDRYFTK